MKKEYQIKGEEFADNFMFDVLRMINEKVPEEFRGMPYARQYVLEVLIEKLKASV